MRADARARSTYKKRAIRSRLPFPSSQGNPGAERRSEGLVAQLAHVITRYAGFLSKAVHWHNLALLAHCSPLLMFAPTVLLLRDSSRIGGMRFATRPWAEHGRHE
jgi:hypothetical protein